MSVVLQMMELLCATARLVSPAENWRVNDDFLPEAIVSGADYRYLCYLYFCQEIAVVVRYKMSQFLTS